MSADTAGQTPEGADVVPKSKEVNILGLKLSVSEDRARRALVSSSCFLLVLNGFGIPFVLMKLPRFLGAPYVPMKNDVVETLFERVLPQWAQQVYPGRKPGGTLCGLRLVDFGSGDGRIVVAAAGRGMRGVGYEMNPYLVGWARWRAMRSPASVGGAAHFRWSNAWGADLSTTDVVTVYGRPGDGLMERLARKFEHELPPHAAVVSHFFALPGWDRLLTQDVNGLKLYDLSLLPKNVEAAKAAAAAAGRSTDEKVE
eukprot:gnl/TRDRNA2_/TRDRNA2_123782_c0_seq1.p1 gnl/TRDRNA2_/TRDRNA2_123782_c0~~gnl/TRDRNA2_/TRDRNA2_123782_c0_seq1.p1  ORF type:complete len:264 (+),score=42.30 gnl/TRDRNA2_/TRDRNA2_123782_c0_seq1:26-793(+)